MIRARPMMPCEKDGASCWDEKHHALVFSQLSREESNAPESLFDLHTLPQNIREVLSPLRPPWASTRFTNRGQVKL